MKLNLLTKLRLAFHSLFYGMKGADEVITQSANYSGDVEVAQQLNKGGVFADLLQQKETQQVKETRDAYYRVFREADKYEVTVNGSLEGDGDLRASARKKSSIDFLKHCNVYNEDGYEVKLIQDNKFISKESNFGFDIDIIKSADSERYIPLIDVERDNFLPRFRIENYANKVVVRTNGKNTHIDFYTTIYASQFGKVDALFISEMTRIMNEKNMKSDTTTLSELRFITDKAYGADDLFLYEYNNLEFLGINIYDGNFVLTFDANVVSDGKDITEKYRMKEMDEKYAKKAPKKDGIDLFTIQRHIDDESNGDDIDPNTYFLKIS